MTTPRDEDRTAAIPAAPVPDGPPPATTPVDPTPTPVGPAPTPGHKPRPTRISGTWVAVVASIVVLIVLLVFILQNLTDATITFFGVSSTLPLGLALLFAAMGGAVVVALVGAARILQLRRQAKRELHRR
ncbi:LapA family protein [Saccharothrix algeriensis]|uniref:Integral membrane protein n=1 Tax=Saccharothrix algeriensis TaxID=173560 RepID=A0ABS2S1N3_9PSEU|nr:lipopolysaccharide assembly protein LapA domain-containing protein [Saccharothrix algeriensis]MBM7810148.1 putative integral membrane protein [Saccharothrix algeriensis]